MQNSDALRSCFRIQLMVDKPRQLLQKTVRAASSGLFASVTANAANEVLLGAERGRQYCNRQQRPI